MAIRRRLALVVSVVLLVSACSGQSRSADLSPYQSERMTSPTGQAELLLRPQGRPKSLVLFMHGFGADQDELLSESGLFPVRNALLRAGFAIATSNAHGDNVGNALSISDQQNLVTDAQTALGSVDAVDILAFSMGGVDALLAAATHAIPTLRAVALLSPVTNTTAFLNTPYRGAISAAYGNPDDLAEVVASRNPILLPVHDYVAYRYGFWRSPSDSVVPAVQSDEMASRLDRAGATATVAALSGDHGNFSQLRPAQVVALFESGGSK